MQSVLVVSVSNHSPTAGDSTKGFTVRPLFPAETPSSQQHSSRRPACADKRAGGEGGQASNQLMSSELYTCGCEN